MSHLTQNTIEGTLVFVTIQTPQTKYQSTDKEFKVGIVVDEDTADSWNERFPKQTAKVVKTSGSLPHRHLRSLKVTLRLRL